MKILVIDDDVLLVRMMTRVLAADGHEVVTAKEGGRGMTLFRESRIRPRHHRHRHARPGEL